MQQRPLFSAVLCAALLLSQPGLSTATTRLGVSLAELTLPAHRIIRGHCLSATAGKVTLAGADIPVTTYAFRVTEYLKGTGPDVVVFRQVGTADPGPGDLGRLAGLPVYVPGVEYVLFLLPDSRAGLTSPSGAGDGALRILGSQVVPIRGLIRDLTGIPNAESAPSTPYRTLRQGVLELSGR